MLPAAARTNQAMFYDRNTQAPRSTEQIMARLDGIVANQIADAGAAQQDAERKRHAGLLGDQTTAALLALQQTA